MKGHSLIKHFFAVGIFFLVSTSYADNNVTYNPGYALPQWGPQATVGGFLGISHNTTNNMYKFVFGNFLVPILQDDNSLLYIDGRQIVSSGCCDYTTNLGAGYRRIINNSFILGGYGFADYEHTLYENNLYQGQLGGEYISPTWQARINGYVPVGDRNHSAPSNIPIGNTNQPVIYPGTLTVVEYPFLEHTEAGGDVQIGSALPFAPSFFPFVGYYHFGFDQNLDTSINGGRAGLQYTYNRWLTIFAGDQYDNLRKNTALLGGSVTLGGPQPANCPDVLHSLMEETPFGNSGIF